MYGENAITELIEYNARFYSPSLMRFTQPDTIIPGFTNSQSWNRYSYSFNNPINYTDPSGHAPTGENDDDICLPNPDCYPENNPSGTYYPVLGENDDIMDFKRIFREGLGFTAGALELFELWQEIDGIEWLNPDGEGVTIEQFIAYILIVEAAGNGQELIDLLATAMIQHLWTDSSGYTGGHAPFCYYGDECIVGALLDGKLCAGGTSTDGVDWKPSG